MKVTIRLLLTLPFLVVTFLCLKLHLADNGCWGLIETMYTVILFIMFAISNTVAFLGTLRKRQVNKEKPEPITLTIIWATFFVLIIGSAFGENFKEKKWIYAVSKHQNLRAQTLTLRDNGTFRVDLNEVDFGCYFSRTY